MIPFRFVQYPLSFCCTISTHGEVSSCEVVAYLRSTMKTIEKLIGDSLCLTFWWLWFNKQKFGILKKLFLRRGGCFERFVCSTFLTVKPDVLLMGTLQCCGPMFQYWLTVWSNQLATFNSNLLEQVAKFRFSFCGINQGKTSSVSKKQKIIAPWSTVYQKTARN